MSKRKHLEKAIQILRDNFEGEIVREGDWSYNLKNWTINFLTYEDFESVVAYKVKDGLTQWGEYLTIEKRRKVWEELA